MGSDSDAEVIFKIRPKINYLINFDEKTIVFCDAIDNTNLKTS